MTDINHVVNTQPRKRRTRLIALLSAAVVACSGIHIAPSFAQGSGSTPAAAGVTPENQNTNDLYVSNVRHEKFENNKLEVNGHGGWIKLNWNNTHPGQEETAPVVGRKFEIVLPNQLIFFKNKNQAPPKDFPMELLDKTAVGTCSFKKLTGSTDPDKATKIRTITCALDQRAVDAWNKGKRNFKGDFEVRASNAGSVTAQSLNFQINGATVPVPLPDGKIGPFIGVNYDYGFQKSVNNPGGPDARINWYFLIGGQRLKKKFATNPEALSALTSRDKMTLTIIDTLNDPALYFAEADLQPTNFTLRKRINHPTAPECTADQYANDEAGTNCYSVNESVPADFRIERVPGTDNQVKIHISADFEEDAVYTIGGLNSHVRNNVVQDYAYQNTAEMKFGEDIKIGDGRAIGRWRIFNKATAQYTDGFGGFQLWKKFEGDHASKFDSAKKFVITYKTKAPGEAAFSEPQTLEVPAFHKVDPKQVEFLAGTEILIEEVLEVGSLTSDQPIDGKYYVWGTPVLKVAGQPLANNTITIENKKTITVDLFNKPELANTGTLFLRKLLITSDNLQNLPENVRNARLDLRCDRAPIGENVGADGSFTKRFEVPANGNSVNAGIFPTGTTCSVTEDTTNIEIPNYERSAPVVLPSGPFTIRPGQDETINQVTVTNTYTKVKTGKLFIKKTVAPASAEKEGSLKEVQVSMKCSQAPVAKPASTPDIQPGVLFTIPVPADGDDVEIGTFNVGTTCSEVTEAVTEDLRIPNHELPTPSYNKQELTIAEGVAPEVNRFEVTNTYTKIKTGKLFIKKSVAPDSAVAEGSTKTAQVSMKCSAAPLEKPDATPDITANTAFTIAVPANGTSIEIGTFPVGTVCNEVAETNVAELGIAHHELPTPSYNKQELTIAEGVAPEVNRFEVTNTYAPIQYVPFKVKKAFVGLIGDVKPASLSAVATCNAASKAGVSAGTKIELPVKLDGTDTVFGEFPVGTVCQVESENVAPIANYLLTSQEISPAVTLAQGGDNRVTLTNTYEFKKGAFKFKKVVVDADSTLPADQKFEFTYRCEQPVTKAENEGKVSLGHNEEHIVTDIPVGSVCQVEEGAKITKVVEWTVATDKEATITVAENAEPIVTFTNTFTKPVGGFTVSKAVNIADAQKNLPIEVPKDFTFDYTCELPATTGSEIAFDLGAPASGTLTLKAGETKTVSGVVAGSVCTLTEKNSGAADSDVNTVVSVDGTETAGVTAKVTVTKDALAKVAYTNTYTSHAGVVVVNKVLDGSAKELAAVKDHTFAATVVCTKGSFNKTYPVQLKAGTPVEIPDVPVGAECKVSETLTGNDIAGARFDTDPASVTDVVVPAITNGNKSEVTLTNVYTELGAVKITKTLAGISAGQGKDKTFTVTAKWQDKGVEVTRELTLTPGVEQVINDVPVGAEVTFTERLPENTALASWNVPEFLGGEQVVDHKNGSAVVRVTAGSFAEGIKVELRNTANPPLWWLLIGAIPLVAAITPRIPLPSPAPTPTPEQAEVSPKLPEQKVKGMAKKPAEQKGLANTGANVLWVLFGGLLLAALGGILVALRRRES